MHYKYYEEDLQATLKSEVNPFSLHDDWVDRDIKVGDIDEEVRAVQYFRGCVFVFFFCIFSM